MGLPEDRPDITTLETIAKYASIGKIFKFAAAAMFEADDMINSAAKCCVLFMDETIFT
jgi:hypothetical protein